MILLFLEFLGTSEVLVILVVALLLFGPRKLPELSRSFGKSLAEFKRASEEFKQTWEKEVAMEEVEKGARIERAMIPEDPSTIGAPVSRRRALLGEEAELSASETQAVSAPAPFVRTLDSTGSESTANHSAPAPEHPTSPGATPLEPTRKRDWL